MRVIHLNYSGENIFKFFNHVYHNVKPDEYKVPFNEYNLYTYHSNYFFDIDRFITERTKGYDTQHVFDLIHYMVKDGIVFNIIVQYDNNGAFIHPFFDIHFICSVDLKLRPLFSNYVTLRYFNKEECERITTETKLLGLV